VNPTLPRGHLFGLAISLSLASTGAFAQSTQVVGERAATAQGIFDAVRQNDKDLIDREVFGNPGGAAKGATIAVFPTGRLRSTRHRGFDIHPIVTNPIVGDDGIRRTHSFAIEEESALLNMVLRAPQNVMGGQLTVSAFVGYTNLRLNVRPNDANPGEPNTIGDGGNESLLAGGSVLFARDSAYVMASAVGHWGKSRLTDLQTDFTPDGPPPPHDYSYRTHGFVGTLTAGRVFPLSGNPNGPMLDIRGALGWTESKNKPFLNVMGDEFRVRLSTWTATGSTTLFINLPQANKAVLRPYVQGYVRQEFGYDYKLAFTQSGPDANFTLTSYNQDHTYGGVDAGVSYTLDSMTFGLAAYYEASGDERTIGGRIRWSWQFFGGG
jgi:hypothetical protein